MVWKTKLTQYNTYPYGNTIQLFNWSFNKRCVKSVQIWSFFLAHILLYSYVPVINLNSILTLINHKKYTFQTKWMFRGLELQRDPYKKVPSWICNLLRSESIHKPKHHVDMEISILVKHISVEISSYNKKKISFLININFIRYFQSHYIFLNKSILFCAELCRGIIQIS